MIAWKLLCCFLIDFEECLALSSPRTSEVLEAKGVSLWEYEDKRVELYCNNSYAFEYRVHGPTYCGGKDVETLEAVDICRGACIQNIFFRQEFQGEIKRASNAVLPI